MDQSDLVRLADLSDEVTQIAETAQPDLAAQMNYQVSLLKAFISEGDGGALDTTSYRAAGYEIANLCLDVL